MLQLHSITEFLSVIDVVNLSAGNRLLRKNIIGDKADSKSGNPFLKERIKIAKTRFNKKIYMVLNEVAKTQCKELLGSGNHFVVGEAKNFCGSNTDAFVTVILEQLMFFDIWSMDKSLSGQDRSSMIYLKYFLNKDELKTRKKILFDKQYTIDNLSRCDWCNVFVDHLEIYLRDYRHQFHYHDMNIIRTQVF